MNYLDTNKLTFEEIMTGEKPSILYEDKCRLCKSKHLSNIMSFGECSLANEYIKPENINKPELNFSLTVDSCQECGNVQLRETVSPDLLFKNYLYASSQSPGLVKHFNKFAYDVKNFLDIQSEDLVLEIGSNDGITLKSFYDLGIQVLGVEPAENLAKIAILKNLETINSYFNENLSNFIKLKYKTPKIILATNTYAHLAEHESVTKGVRNLMDDNTIFIIENAWLLDTIKGLYFDQVYHDHLLMLGVKPLVKYFNKFDMEIFHIERTPIQGGSIRCYIKTKANKKIINESVENFIKQENNFNLYSLKTYEDFNSKLSIIKNNFLNKIKNIISENKTISCYGCPAKFALFSKFFNLNNKNIKYVVDDSLYKQGLFSPYGKIPIVSKNHFEKNPTDYCIVSAWNFYEDIIKNNSSYSGVWLNPFLRGS